MSEDPDEETIRQRLHEEQAGRGRPNLIGIAQTATAKDLAEMICEMIEACPDRAAIVQEIKQRLRL